MKSLSPTDIHYFDYNATHPPFRSLLVESVDEYLDEYFNPSGATRYSLSNQGKIEKVRKYFSSLTNTPEKNLVFSSTGTEANYLLLRALRKKQPELSSVIVSPFEHSSMYKAIEDHHFSMRIIKTDLSGIIQLSHLEELLEEKADPIICLHTGNETGVIQPTSKISKLALKFGVYFLSDLMQAFGKYPVQFQEFSGYTFSSHKIGGGMGAALTGINFDLENYSLFGGGNQENSHRAGTENLPAILAFSKASELQTKELAEKNKKLSEYRKKIEEQLELFGCEIIAKSSPRTPNTSYVLLPIEEIDFFLLGMEERGFIISTGSSCKSRAREASSSLLAMGYTKDESLRCVRISTGIFTTETEINLLLNSFQELLFTFQSVS